MELQDIISKQRSSLLEQLTRFRDMDDADFEQVLEEVLKEAREGELNLKQYPILFSLLEKFVKIGLMDQDAGMLAYQLFMGIKIDAEQSTEYFPSRDLELWSARVEKRSKEHERILKRVLELNEQVREKQRRVSGDRLVGLADSEPQDFLEELYSFVEDPPIQCLSISTQKH